MRLLTAFILLSGLQAVADTSTYPCNYQIFRKADGELIQRGITYIQTRSTHVELAGMEFSLSVSWAKKDYDGERIALEGMALTKPAFLKPFDDMASSFGNDTYLGALECQDKPMDRGFYFKDAQNNLFFESDAPRNLESRLAKPGVCVVGKTLQALEYLKRLGPPFTHSLKINAKGEVSWIQFEDVCSKWGSPQYGYDDGPCEKYEEVDKAVVRIPTCTSAN